MEGETLAVTNNSGMVNAHQISVLVVDDDTTCLAIIAAKLKKFQYHVVTVKNPNEALYTLRIQAGTYHLVVSDVHMPGMSGIQLQQVIAREFNLPVVLMSADKKEDVVLEGLESGAAFYIAKPVTTADLKDLWQFAITKKKKSSVVIEETGCLAHEINTSSKQTNNSDAVGVNNSDAVGGNASSRNDIAGSTSSVNEVNHDHNKDTKRKSHNKDSKRKSPQKEESSGKGKEISETAAQKKKKVVWTNSLHNQFLDAINSIGLDRAVPKKILEVMDVPSLTRENVASHLQKYRIFLRRVMEDANLKLQCSDTCSISRTFSLRSSSSISNPFLNNLTTLRNPYPGINLGATNTFFLNREGSSSDMLSQLRYGQPRVHSNGGSMMLTQNPETFLGAENAFFLNQEGSLRDVLGQSRFGQSQFLSNEGSMLNPNIVGTSRTIDNGSTGLAQNIYHNTNAVQGNISGALLPHFNPLVLGSTPGGNLEIADYGFPNSDMHDGTIHPTFNPSSSTMLKDCATPTNYVGLDISNVQQLLAKAAGKRPVSDGRRSNLASNLEFQNSTTVGTAAGPSESPAINADQMAGYQWLDDFLAEECQTLVHPNGQGGSTCEAYSFSPLFDLDELTNLPLDQECNLNPTIPPSTGTTVNVQDYNNVSSFDPVVNVQNQVQDFGNISSFDQPLNEVDEEAFLESLLAPGLDLYEQNPNIEGI